MKSSAEIRDDLVCTLEMNVIGPWPGSPNAHEILRHKPMSWYLTGFLISKNTDPAAKRSAEADEDLSQEGSVGDEDEGLTGGDEADGDEATPDKVPAKAYYPSSMGLSFLVSPQAEVLKVTLNWGEYFNETTVNEKNEPIEIWKRKPREAFVTLDLKSLALGITSLAVPGHPGLALTAWAYLVDSKQLQSDPLPDGTKAISLFWVNEKPIEDHLDSAALFQAKMSVACDCGFLPRVNFSGSRQGDDFDERIADLQYRDVYDYATGHNVSAYTETLTTPSAPSDPSPLCATISTSWLPRHEVEQVAHVPLEGVLLEMEALAQAPDFKALRQGLMPLVEKYRQFILAQASSHNFTGTRKETAQELYHSAERMAKRVEAGINLLQDDTVRRAFQWANATMARAQRQRFGVHRGQTAESVSAPQWRAFQLAYMLMNLSAMVDGKHPDRESVDLLFFPTGGGKTEAYLGLAAFTLVYRRLTHPGIEGAGVSVLMRYTLRLLTLDQLTRASLLICALELLREEQMAILGDWPFEIGLWVGTAATPNRLGESGDGNSFSARSKINRYKANPRPESNPIPLEACPWCNRRFSPESLIFDSGTKPKNLWLRCEDSVCEFGGKLRADRSPRYLPLITVDEPLYRRLPCFLISTVDKFASLPWEGRSGALFGKVQRHDRDGFYGPCDEGGVLLPGRCLPPPDLIIQDELHLISGPLGTVVGLFETVIDELSTRHENGKPIRPKIIASTATVRRASEQIRALFARDHVDIFPPPLPNRRHNFFAVQKPTSEARGRLYIGLAAPGRGPKEMLLRTFVTLLSAAQTAYQGEQESLAAVGLKTKGVNAADPYMTLVAYFNSLKELGASRRIIEDEGRSRTGEYHKRARKNEEGTRFVSRELKEPLELTSRVNTAQVAEAYRRLAAPHHDPNHVDVALATNMISVGLDIGRLGLLTVFGQPKTTSEYIQATSRVGREADKPGLVLTLFNANRPRDRSHFERFNFSHAAFYRAVEATSVTPFSPRSLDRGLVDMMVAIFRHAIPELTPAHGVARISEVKEKVDAIIERICDRVKRHDSGHDAERLQMKVHEVRDRLIKLRDSWDQIISKDKEVGVKRQYRKKETAQGKPLFFEPLDPDVDLLPDTEQQFKVHRSMREVEAAVEILIRNRDQRDLPQDKP